MSGFAGVEHQSPLLSCLVLFLFFVLTPCPHLTLFSPPSPFSRSLSPAAAAASVRDLTKVFLLKHRTALLPDVTRDVTFCVDTQKWPSDLKWPEARSKTESRNNYEQTCREADNGTRQSEGKLLNDGWFPIMLCRRSADVCRRLCVDGYLCWWKRLIGSLEVLSLQSSDHSCSICSAKVWYKSSACTNSSESAFYNSTPSLPANKVVWSMSTHVW